MFCIGGCENSTDPNIENQPNISGTVVEVYENSILIESDGSPYYVSLSSQNIEHIDSPIAVGDEVTVYFDGNIAESYPMQIHNVYAVMRSNNKQ
ncbi:MAG: DUF3221 domain-containing protein [Clostridia bacterium]|nr:DUF3221 domain-containing protein [Clostridia bacterium]